MAVDAAEIGNFKDALIVLATAGVVVPLMHRLRISPIIGFLAAGACLGPHGLGALSGAHPWLRVVTIRDVRDLSLFAELGVVFLLFAIGLELSLGRMLTLRRLVFGMGSLQVVASTALLALAALMLGLEPHVALLVGAALSLSSTAIVIELLSAQRRIASETGRASFAMLILQDLAVVPLILLVGALASDTGGSVSLSAIKALAVSVLVLALVIAVGRLVLRPFFHIVASTGGADLLMAATLLVVAVSGIITVFAGMSMAIGAFAAGLLLAETEYRRAIEAIIEPFKGILLGIFFFTVGMGLDIDRLIADPLSILAIMLAVLILKSAIAYGLARLFHVSTAAALEAALLLGPAGEFTVVLLGLMLTERVIDIDTYGSIVAAVTIGMISLPGIAALARQLGRRTQNGQDIDVQSLTLGQEHAPATAVVVGFGRVGQLVAEMLQRHGITYVAIDNHAPSVSRWRRVGKQVYYGDARSPILLQRSGIKEARTVIVTVSDRAEIDEVVETVRRIRPEVTIVSRARDAAHARGLYVLGVSDAVPETIEASLQLSEAALIALGQPMGPVIASIHERRDEFRSELREGAVRRSRAEDQKSSG
ncbi:MAG: cation:proton antiporter [Hyphomicrobiaceae bacterium]